MDEYIRHLTHDNVRFEHQWSEILNNLIQFMNDDIDTDNDTPLLKTNCLNAVTDYIIVDSTTNDEPNINKFDLVDIVVKFCRDNPRPSLESIMHNFLKLLNEKDIFNRWYLVGIQSFYVEFKLAEWLLSKPSLNFIETIFRSLQNHSFCNSTADKQLQSEWGEFLGEKLFSKVSGDRNKLNNDLTVGSTRSSLQQLFRHAVRMSHQSSVWSKVLATLSSTLLTLFDVYENHADSQNDLTACVTPPLSFNFISLLSQSYKHNLELFKMNSSQIYTAIEKLILMDQIEKANCFVFRVIMTHFNTAVDVEVLLRMCIRVCSLVSADYRCVLCKEILGLISDKLHDATCNKNLAFVFFDFAIALLKMHVMDATECAWNVLSKDNFFSWLDLAPHFSDLVRLCISYDAIDQQANSNSVDKLEDILRLVVRCAVDCSAILQATHAEALRAVLCWCEWTGNDPTKLKRFHHVFKMGCPLLDLIDQQQITIDICRQLLAVLQRKINEQQDSSVDRETNSIVEQFLVCMATRLSAFLKSYHTMTEDMHIQLSSFCSAASSSRPLKHTDGQASFEYRILSILWRNVCQSPINENQVHLYEKSLKMIHSLAVENSEDDLFNLWNLFWKVNGSKMIDVAVNYIEEFLIDITDGNHFRQFSLLPIFYMKRPQLFHDRLDHILNALFNEDQSSIIVLTQLLWIIATLHPELITSAQVDRFFAGVKFRADITDEVTRIFEVLGFVTNTRPHLFHNYHDLLVHFVHEQKNIATFACLQEFFVASVIIGGEQTAQESITILINGLNSGIETANDIRPQIFETCQLIGLLDKPSVECKHKDLLPFNAYGTCRMLLDFIENKTMSDDNEFIVKVLQEKIEQIEKRLIKAKHDVQQLIKTVPSSEPAKTIENDAIIHGQTFNHSLAVWSHEVCNLLNHRADNDWHLLGKHLGYSATELKHWALQPDPTMALLNEWFMTHDSEKATYGLMKVLDEIGRSDATKIIRDKLSVSINVSSDGSESEMQRLPPIFLSYHGSQCDKIVLALKHRLERAGYACWMKDDQTTNANKSINQTAAMYGVKIFICCIDIFYIEEEECLHEIQSIINTGKPLILLNMENRLWDVNSTFGRIVRGYVYLSFHIHELHTHDDFPADKFVELLGQIRYYLAPNTSMIVEPYRNWFVPRINSLIFLQPTSTGERDYRSIFKTNLPLVITQPDIVISYEWDRQANIVHLYKRLTSLGYRCWLDIFQMGGSDPLIEKVNSGMHSAKCVIACVTRKYTRTIHCLSELSHANALSKPIIPLLLEETSRWPPLGPMSLLLAETTYLDFCHRDENCEVESDDLWLGKEFEKLIVNLEEILPEVNTTNIQRHMIEVKRPTSGTSEASVRRQSTRPKSAPVIPQSRACCIM